MGELVEGLVHGAVEALAALGVCVLAQFFEITTGDEGVGACASDDEGADGGGLGNGCYRGCKCFLSSPIQGVALLGTVDTEGGDACVLTVELDAHGLSVAGHGGGSSLGLWVYL